MFIGCNIRCSLVVRQLCSRMASSLSYESAVHKLNALQSNKATIQQIHRDIKTGQKCRNIDDMENYLQRCGVSLSTLDKLSVIHIAGTKGKGSTSAMCESILRNHGFRTGFYSSPHLVSVCERIRLNGLVITREKFAKYFHEVYDMLEASQAYTGDMPKYFAFLTVLAYKIFLAEKVDVAIVEVGIGGVVDYTNVLRKVPIVGITSLGLDHTSILGYTLSEIALAKAGIMKPGCEAYTVVQPTEAMEVLQNVANQVKCPLHIVPDYKTYSFPKGHKSDLPINIEAYKTNASLAIQLAHAWMRVVIHNNNVVKINKKKISQQNRIIDEEISEKSTNDYTFLSDIFKVPMKTLYGVQECKWPGRYQVVKSDYAQFYLDGAHTKESMEICASWFMNTARSEEKILIFSATGDRNVVNLLKPLKGINFKSVHFVIPTAHKETSQKNDNFSVVEQNDLVDKCKNNAIIWDELHGGHDTITSVHECVHDALVDIKKNHKGSSVLITGSLHLVGACLGIIYPSLNRN